MGFDNLFHYVIVTLEVFFLDLLLSGDNAMVIALACRLSSPEQARRAMWLGIGGAIALRVLLTTFAGFLLTIPVLKLIGGIALTLIAIKLTIEEVDSDRGEREKSPGFYSTVGTIVVADLVMSIDNVVALAAVAQGSIIVLTIGLLMSVPLLMFGSLFVTTLLQRYPLLIRGGGAMLGWIAGDIAISDPMVSGWVAQQAPALTVVVPILTVAFVLIESRIIEDAQASAYVLRPKRRAEPMQPEPAAANTLPAAIERTPATAIIPVVSRSVEAVPPAPVSATESIEAPAQLEPRRAPPIDAATSHVQAPRRRRYSPTVWLIAAALLAVLWILFRSLSLDFTPTTPALQFTPPR
jgi:YjbE family integral membrane protein